MLQMKLEEWWLSKIRSPCLKTVLSFIHIAICWELWRARNQGWYDDSSISALRIISNVKGYVIAAFSGAAILAKRSYRDREVKDHFLIT